MLEKLARSWSLARASLEVVKADKELLWAPVMSAVALLFLAASFIAPVVVSGWLTGAVEREDPALLIWGATFYLGAYFVTFYFNTVLVAAAMIRLDGGNPTLVDGIRAANERIWTILGYAVIAATVGIILRSVEERVGWLGRIVIAFVGAAWTVATFLVVPVLVAQRVGPVDAVKESAGLLRKTWGENIVGSAGIGLAFGALYVALALIMVPLMMVSAEAFGLVPFIVLMTVFVASLIGLAALQTTLQGVYSAAVYRYATRGEPGFGFGADQVQQAFAPRRK